MNTIRRFRERKARRAANAALHRFGLPPVRDLSGLRPLAPWDLPGYKPRGYGYGYRYAYVRGADPKREPDA